MARRRSTRSTKIQPAVETLTFDLGLVDQASLGPASVPGKRIYYCDISQCASLANRRFYRQGLQWMVGGARLISTNVSVVTGIPYPEADSPNGSIMISKLPSTWVMSNAWEKGFRAWQGMNARALEDSPSLKPGFMDFKVFADAGHHFAYTNAVDNIIPVVHTLTDNFVTGFTEATQGEWEYSKILVPNTTNPANSLQYEITAVGKSYPNEPAQPDTVSLIEGYANSRGLPDILDPNTPDNAADAAGFTPENWISALTNEGNTQDANVIADLIEDNNQAPYPFENDGIHLDTFYPGGENQLEGLQIHSIENISGSTIGGVTYLPGGVVPCGLLKIEILNSDQAFQQYNVLQLDLVPGPHRGYMCEPMTEM